MMDTSLGGACGDLPVGARYFRAEVNLNNHLRMCPECREGQPCALADSLERQSLRLFLGTIEQLIEEYTE